MRDAQCGHRYKIREPSSRGSALSSYSRMRRAGRAGSPMQFRDRFGIRRWRGATVTRLDREATSDDIEALIAFARSRRGVEFFVEPETFATDTTAVAVASDGEWPRRRVGSPKAIGKVARDLALP